MTTDRLRVIQGRAKMATPRTCDWVAAGDLDAHSLLVCYTCADAALHANARADILWLVNQLRRHQDALLLAREQRNEYVPEYDQVFMDEDIDAALDGEGEA